MTIDPITQYLLEAATSSLPNDLQQSLLRYGVYGVKHGKSISPSDINKLHSSIISDINKSGPYQFKRNKDEKKLYDASRKTSAFIKTQMLKGIYAVADGDFIFYSMKDKNLYLWDHELSVFTALIKPSKGKVPYRKIIPLLKSDNVESCKW